MSKPHIRFQIESPLEAEYAWTIRELGRFVGFIPEFTEQEPDVTVSELGISDIQVSHFFRSQYAHGDYNWNLYFHQEPLHYLVNGKPDYLSTCFYLLGCLQEYAPFQSDLYGRFPFTGSWQQAFQVVAQNKVAAYFECLWRSTPALNKLIDYKPRASQLLLTHDIDTLFGAVGEQWKPLAKRGRVADLFQLIWNHYMKQPDYMLLEKIMDIEDEYDVRSVFFWLTERGKGRNGIPNADYHIHDPKVVSIRHTLKERGAEQGLHKSALKTTYAEELESLQPDDPIANRNHFLRFFMPDTWTAMENAGVQVDLSLGFPEQPGFRAGYGLPFFPFNPMRKGPVKVLEVPLLVMDTSYKYYMHFNANQAGRHLIDFLDQHRENAVLSILWHNNYFFDRLEPGWVSVYKDVLKWAAEHQIAATGIRQLYADFS